MRDLETIDSEVRLLAAVRWSIREHGGEPSSHRVDELKNLLRDLESLPAHISIEQLIPDGETGSA